MYIHNTHINERILVIYGNLRPGNKAASAESYEYNPHLRHALATIHHDVNQNIEYLCPRLVLITNQGNMSTFIGGRFPYLSLPMFWYDYLLWSYGVHYNIFISAITRAVTHARSKYVDLLII